MKGLGVPPLEALIVMKHQLYICVCARIGHLKTNCQFINPSR